MKDILVVAKLKVGKFDKFMGFMQSEEGMAERRKVAHVEKTVPGILPDKSGVMFKVHVHDEEAMKDFVTGRNPAMKPIYDECIDSMQLFELSEIDLG